MEHKSIKLWKLRLIALGFGVLATVIVCAIALIVSNDLRVIYTTGAVFLFCAATWLGRLKSDWVSAVLLAGPLVAFFSADVLNTIPALWLTVLLWIGAAVVGVFFVRICKPRGLAAASVGLLVITSAGYCAWYAPNQLAKSFSHVRDVSAPTFALQPVSSGSVPATSTPGKVLVLSFFSTTCAPCIAELPEFAAAHDELSQNRDIEFVLVASDRGRDTPERFRSFIERRHFSIPLAFDPGGKAHDSLGLSGVPALVVLDRNGHVRFTHSGYNAAETGFRRDLVQLLKKL